MKPEQSTEPVSAAIDVGSLVRDNSRPWFWRSRVQLVILLAAQFAAVIVPLLAGIPLTSLKLDALFTSVAVTSFFWSAAASIVGYGIIRQLVSYPGSSSALYIFPALIVSYAALIMTMFFVRYDYSRYVILESFIGTLLWLHIICWFRDRHDVPVLGVLPTIEEKVDRAMAGPRWIHLVTPADSFRGLSGIVADLNADMSPAWERFIAQCVLAGIPVYDLRNLSELLSGRVDIKHLSESTFGSVLPSNMYLRLKRAIEFLLAILLLPFFAVAIACAALAIKFESAGPILFTQPRMGYRGSHFTIYKLRSMRAGGQLGEDFTQADDPRITRVGRFIRKFRIDEFPQILNVMRGDMSWIGPRPESLALATWYANEIPFYVYRHAVRPGISGWAQVNQGNVAEVDAATVKLQYDFFYIKYFSPWLDLLVLLKTIQTIMTGFGSK